MQSVAFLMTQAKVVEERYRRKSTLTTAQVPVAGWHDLIADPTVADAILNRIVPPHHLQGDRIRCRNGAIAPEFRSIAGQIHLPASWNSGKFRRSRMPTAHRK
ncbi:ATP-binding protein [Ensifer sp. IC4062]|nr:ATP-binding protein [Ensifer sp. IC4062]